MTHVLVADDDATIRTVIGRALSRAGCQVESAASAQGLMRLVGSGRGDVLVTDVMLPDGDSLTLLPRIRAARPDLPVIVISAQSTLATAVRAEQGGAFDYLPKPFDLDALVRAVSAAAGRARSAPAGAGSGQSGAARPGDGLPMVGKSPAMQDVYRLIARLVPTTLPVLVTGESGTGKELVARALHDLGTRADRPFVAVNMAAIPRELIESELFGHERGAFTGATTARAGRFEQAQGGTLFLDEIGDMPLEAQTRLLRVLQSGEFTTVGGADARRADVRVVSATNKDLSALVADGRFREDLYYRLAVVPIHLPPLRERREDIPELARLFLERAPTHGLPRRRLAPDAEKSLQRFDWPGNVRELENLMRRLAALSRDEVLDAAAVDAALAGAALAAPRPPTPGETLAQSVDRHLAALFARHGATLPPDGLWDRLMDEIEPVALAHALDATGGNQLRAARLLGVNRNTLRKKLNERGVDPHRPLE
jgi:two-component system nitrogen regulation response regulator GlnG